ncbi:MAG TPA: phosphotransferase [Steroidobacteraceae bacterium]|jgi:aminoglycoside phosphotransferase (APT) family kinase protein|nr:phosphotransferase [Steroidobacteraceae bacterium]
MTMRGEATGLKQIPAQHAFDTARLSAWMLTHIAGFSGPIDVQQFAGGQSNPTYLVESPAHRYVLRRKPPGKLLPSAHAVDREFRVLAALRHSPVPVARVHALCEDPEIIGSAFYVMDYVEGRIFWDALLPEVAPADRRGIYREMVRVLAALHSVDYAAVGLSDYGKPSHYVERQVARWTRQYRASETEKLEPMERLIEWLPKHIPADEQTSIVHGDFRLDNTIFHPSEPRILAVLDWELSTLGHPLVDFAYYCIRFHLPVADFRGLGGVDAHSYMIPNEAESVTEYCRLRGIAPVAAQDWDYYSAFCMFRLAGILQGVLARALQGNASSATALQAGRRARPLAELGWKLVQRSFDV